MNRFAAIAFLLFIFATVRAEVKLCGVIDNDLLLQPQKGPYTITGTVLIPYKTTVTVMPGTVIRIQKSTLCTVAVDHPIAKESELPAIIVKGRLDCVGASNNRISIGPDISDSAANEPVWYGIIFEDDRASTGTVAYTDIRGAFRAVTLLNSSPIIRNNLIVANHQGIVVENGSIAQIRNNNVLYNRAAAVTIKNSNPLLSSNIIAYNFAAIIGDKLSRFVVKNNAFWGNFDGHLIDCPPEYGLIRKINHRKDACDDGENIFIDPVFMGSNSHLDSIRRDVTVATDTIDSDVANKRLSRTIVESIPASVKRENEWKKPHKPWQLSRYSRLIDAGEKGRAYNDNDGTVNDIGMYGGTDIVPLQKKK